MLCPNCETVNADESNFCVSCGFDLREDEETVTRSELNLLQFQLQNLQFQVDDINRALAALGASTTDPAAQPTATSRVQRQPAQSTGPTPAAATSATPAAPWPTIPPPPLRREGEETARPSAGRTYGGDEIWPNLWPHASKTLKDFNWEPIIGGNWLARIGALAVIIGVAFFLSLAFENNWINETSRVILGVVVAIGFLAAGEYWRKKYSAYAQALSGTGVALFYLSIFAAFATFDLIDLYTATSLLLLISITSAIYAIRQDSISLAVIGIAGAFFAPFILGAFNNAGTESISDSTGNAIGLLIYILVVDIGVIILATFKNWQWFTGLALAGSLATFGLWHQEYIEESAALITKYGRSDALLIAEAGLTGIFLNFVAATTLFHLIWRRSPQPLDLSLMLITATAYMGISYGLMWEEFRDWMGGFTILISALYGGLGYVALKRVGVEAINIYNPSRDMLLTSILFGIALLLLTVAIPVQIGGPWISVVWTAEAVLLIWLSFRQRMPEIRFTGLLIFAAAAFWLGVIDTPEAFEEDLTPFWNRYLPAYLIAIAGMWFAAYLYKQNEDQVKKDEKDVFPILAVVGILFLGLATPIQIRGPWLAVAWTVEAAVLMWVAFNQRIRAVRYGALAVFAASAIWLAAVETPELFDDSLTPFWNIYLPIYLIVVAGIGIAAYLVRQNNDQITGDEKLLFPALTIAGIFFVALGTPVQVSGAWMAVAWAIEGVALTWVSIRLGLLELQLAAFSLLGLAVIEATGYESVVDSDGYTVVWNSRFLAFGPLVLAICAAAYLWTRASSFTKTVEPRIVANVLAGIASMLTLWFLSAEVIGAVQSDAVVSVSDENETNVVSVGLTVLWAVYGGLVLGTGFLGGWRAVRLGGLILLAIPVFKLFLIDSFLLESGFRVVAFLTLGVILLAGGYLYQRHSETITELFIRPTQPPTSKLA